MHNQRGEAWGNEDSRLQTSDSRQTRMRDYTKIIAWQKADNLAVIIYRISRLFPKEELYGLTSQIRRACYSVPANIAEGASRESKKDYLHFLHIARGSLSEVRYFLHLAHRLEFMDQAAHTQLDQDVDEVARVLHGLISSVESEVHRTKV